MSLELVTPIAIDSINELNVGDTLYISGNIFCGRDAVLPEIVKCAEDNRLSGMGIDLTGGVVFHTAVSPAGIGPTSSNKLEIESSIPPLSRYGIRIHLGKGRISEETIAELEANNSIYAVIPPVTALLSAKTIEKEAVAFTELGMEAFYRLKVDKFPAIVAAAHGRSIYD